MKKVSQAERARLRKASGDHLKTAERLLKSGELDKAMESVERAMEVDPKNAYAHAYKERILELKRDEGKKKGEQLEQEERKLAEEADRKWREADEKKLQEEEETRLRAQEEAQKRQAEEQVRRIEKQQRLDGYLSEARTYLQEGKFEKAIDETEKALQLDPNNPDAVQLDTKIHHEKLEREKRTKEDARWKLEEEERRKRQEEERRRREAEEFESRGRTKEIDQLLASTRDLLEQEEFEKALEAVEQALHLNPRYEPSIQLEQEVRKQMMEEKLRSAEDKLKRKEAKEKRRALLREIQQYLERAENFYSNGEFEKALDEIIHAFSLDPTHPQAKEIAKKVQGAIEDKARAEEEERRRREEEERQQARLKKIQGHLQLAKEYLQKEKFDKATDEVKRVYELDVENTEAKELHHRIRDAERQKKIQDHLEKAEAYLQKKMFDMAVREASSVYEFDLENAEAKELVQRIQQAEEEARRKAEEDERRRREEEAARREEEKKRRIEAIFRKAEEYFQNGKYQKALDEIERVRPIDPDNSRAVAFENKARTALDEEIKARRKAEQEAARLAEKKRKVEGILQQAEKHFLNGAYERALSDIASIYMIEPGHVEATDLRESVRKAREEEEKAAAAGVVVEEKQKVRARRRISPRRRAQRRKRMLVGSFAIVVIAGIVVFSTKDTLLPGPPSLAIISLTSESGDPREDYIADGLTAALISDFGTLPGLKMVGTTTSLSFKNRSVHVAMVGRELGVSYVLSGSASMSSNRVNVYIEVRDTVRGEKLWSKQFSERLTSLERMREEVFNSVTKLLNIQVSQIQRPYANPWSTDPEAVDFFLQAMDKFRERNAQSLQYSIRLFDRALAEDPNLTHAIAAKAYALALLYEREWEDIPGALETASDYSREVIATDVNSVLGYRTLGSVYRQQRSYAVAIDQLQKALAINPHDVGSQVELALLYGMKGDIQKGIGAATKVLEMDPKNFEAHLALALVHHLAGNFEEAVVAYDQVAVLRHDIVHEVLELYDGALIDQHAHVRAQNLYALYLEDFPNDYTVIYRLARSIQIAGQPKAAEPQLNKVISLARQEISRYPRSARAYLYIGLAQTRLGKMNEGADAAMRAIELAPGDYRILYKVAGLYSLQKNTEEALKWFRKAVQKRYSFKGILDNDLFNIRKEQEFLLISRNP